MGADSLVWLVFPTWIAAYVLDLRSATFVAIATVAAVAGLYVGDSMGWTWGEGPPRWDQELRLLTAVTAVLVGLVVSWAQERRWREYDNRLRAHVARTQQVLEALPDALLVLDAGGNVLTARVPEDSVVRSLGSLGSQPLQEVLGHAHAARLVHSARELAAGKAVAPYELTLGDASAVVGLECRFAPHPDGGVLVQLCDTTARREHERLRDEFLAMVSHELRTPLTSIHGSPALVRAGAVGDIPERAQGVVELAWRNSERLRRLIDDLLDVQAIGSVHLELRWKTVSLQEQLQAGIDANRMYGKTYNVSLELLPVSPEVSVRVDVDRLQQVLANLLSNAVKFSQEGGVVRVTANLVAGDRVRVSVMDDGAGIPEAFRSRVFDTFAQADSSQTRNVGGTGLGLSISRSLVEAFGGTIDFDSTHGEGTTFWFELPVASGTGE